jgi:RimJ/RimL family protein N-acetyltransferase
MTIRGTAGGNQHAAVVLKADGVLISDCGLTHTKVAGVPEVKLGYDLRSVYWHCGLATEAATPVRDHAFEVLKVPRLVSLIRQGNLASQRGAEQAGMRLVRSLVQHGTAYLLYACSHVEDEPSVG